MREKLEELRREVQVLEPDSSQKNSWMSSVLKYAHDFIDGLPQGKTFVNSLPSADLSSQLSITEDQPASMDQLIDILDSEIDKHGLNPASGGHLGYIPGGGIYPTAIGDFLAAVTNRYAGIYFGGPGAVHLENYLIQWMCGIMGYPASAHGNLTSGGSIANLIAITTARDHLQIEAEKVRDAVIYLTKQTHHCVQKAIRIAGLGKSILREIELDAQFRMDAEHLRVQIEQDKRAGLNPFLIVASAGSTDTGAMDPLDAIADIAQDSGCWFHVDAAYGGFFILCDDEHISFKGIERSDSLAIDPHKGLFLSYGSGAVLIKNVEALQKSHHYQANYMQDSLKYANQLSPADLSPELTKHFRGLRLWMPLKLFGLAPFRKALEEKLLLCRYFYEEVQKLGFEVGPYPDLSVCIYRYIPRTGDPNTFNAELIELLHQDGRVFLSSTKIDGIFWIRIAVLAFRTHLDTIDSCLEMLKVNLEKLLAVNRDSQSFQENDQLVP